MVGGGGVIEVYTEYNLQYTTNGTRKIHFWVGKNGRKNCGNMCVQISAALCTRFQR